MTRALYSTNHTVHAASAASMDQLADASVHLVVTSPPYPMIEMWDHVFAQQGARDYASMLALLDAVWEECCRVLVPGGFLCINVGDATRTTGGDFRLYTSHAAITCRCEAMGFQSLPPLLWWKPSNAPNKFMGSGMLPGGAYVTQEHEYVLVFRKGGKRAFAAEDLARRRASAYFWEERNQWFSDIWDFRGVRQELGARARPLRGRSAAFPFELPWRLINMYSLQGDLVLDPFLGTGTTSLAAVAAGRSSVGYELDPELPCLPWGTGLHPDGGPAGPDAAAQGAAAGKAPDPAFDQIHAQVLDPDRLVDLGQVNRERLRRHRDWALAREAGHGPLRYRNRVHDVGVMTAQEQDLALVVPLGFGSGMTIDSCEVLHSLAFMDYDDASEN